MQNGILRLRPTFVHRFYSDLNRLGQSKLKTNRQQMIPERWIGSTVDAINPPPMPSGGLSMIGTGRGEKPTSLRDAIKASPLKMLGEELLTAHGSEFRVLVKLLDPGEPIVFHLHATDRQVKSMPRSFRGHRFGKDEAYYFLRDAPKGPVPYTHAGLHPDVRRRDLIDAVKRGRDYALELSPGFFQEYETGFFVPAGVPHRPGTALTLEIQQPSDVYTLLETHSGGVRMSPQQMHPGFKTLDEAFELIDIKLSACVGDLDQNRLKPTVTWSRGGNEIAWIFPPEVCRTFGGKRLRISTRATYRESTPFVLWIWKGTGTINGERFSAGDEFFVAFGAARTGVDIESRGDEPVEAFTFFPAVA